MDWTTRPSGRAATTGGFPGSSMASHSKDRPAASPVLEAMRRLDPHRPNGPAQQPSLVKQLYALALLNREDAMRRLSGRMPVDMLLAHQPPSLLALASPPTHSTSPAFRERQVLTAAPKPLAKRRPTSRQFGALGMSEAGGGAVHGASALAAARGPSLATTAMGAPGGQARFTRPPMTAPGMGMAEPGFMSMMIAPVNSPSMPQLGAPPERSQSAAASVGGRGRPSGGRGPEHGSLTPLRVTDLEQRFPTRTSNYRDSNDPVARQALIAQHHAKAGPPLGHKDRLSVRELLQPGGSTARADPATARLNAVARSTSRPSTRDGSLRGTSGYVPDPSVEAEKRDPWKASDEELSAARQKVQHDDDMAAIRMAAAVGAGVGVLPGFGR